MKKLFIISLSLLMLLSLASCKKEEREEVKESEQAEVNVQIGNPYLTLSDEEETEKEAGFEVNLPDKIPSWVKETVYRTIPGELIEVIYKNDENEIRIRIAEGNEDISGVYDSDSKILKEADLDGKKLHIKLNESGLVNVCTWLSEGRTYSLTSTLGIEEEEALSLIGEIR